MFLTQYMVEVSRRDVLPFLRGKEPSISITNNNGQELLKFDSAFFQKKFLGRDEYYYRGDPWVAGSHGVSAKTINHTCVDLSTLRGTLQLQNQQIQFERVEEEMAENNVENPHKINYIELKIDIDKVTNAWKCTMNVRRVITNEETEVEKLFGNIKNQAKKS